MNKFKILTITIIVAYLVLLSGIIIVNKYGNNEEKNSNTNVEAEGVIIEFFRVNGECGHCDEAEEVVNEVVDIYKENVTKIVYPVDQDTYKDNLKKIQDYGLSTPSVVVYNISDKKNISLLKYSDIMTPGKLDNIVYSYIIGKPNFIDETKAEEICLSTPFGDFCIDTTDASLPIVTIILGALDSVNPCSFFVLLFLLSILLYTKSRKRMLLIGGIFIFFSGFIYFLLMAAILNFILVIEQQLIIAIIAGIVAVSFGVLNIKDFFFFKKGPSASIPDSKKPKLYQQMRRIVKITSIPSLMAATVVLAISANTVELLCSFNLPLIYTTILTSYNLSPLQYYLYIFLYNVIYVIPLLLIVSVAVITLGRWKMSEYQGRVLKLFAGLMILSLGLFLLIDSTMLENFLVPIIILLICIFLTYIISFIWKKYIIDTQPEKELSDLNY